MFRRNLCTIRCSVAVLFLVLALASKVGNAQVLYGSLTGNVTDPNNASVPNAKVETLNVGTGIVRQTTTDERGVYRFSNVASGLYTVTVTIPSFRKLIESNVQVNSNEVRRVDVQLQIAQTTETVEVSAAPLALQTDKADVHAEITSQEVEELPYTKYRQPFKFRDNQYTTAINLSKIKGAHSLRFGFDYDKYALNHFQPQGGTFGTARGTFGIDGTLTAQQGGATVNNPVNSFASFLLGFPSETGKVTQFQNPNALRFSNYGIYARDQWQVTSKLTINYGLRWEYYPIFSHDNYGAVRFDPSTDSILIGGEGGVPWNTGASASKTGFAPRFGAAHRVDYAGCQHQWVRAGYRDGRPPALSLLEYGLELL